MHINRLNVAAKREVAKIGTATVQSTSAGDTRTVLIASRAVTSSFEKADLNDNAPPAEAQSCTEQHRSPIARAPEFVACAKRADRSFPPGKLPDREARASKLPEAPDVFVTPLIVVTSPLTKASAHVHIASVPHRP